MKTLYLDTSSKTLYCAVIEDENVIFEISECLEKNMSKKVLSIIEEKFNKFQIIPNSINKILLVNGPGSFTGIRIGATIAKTWAWALNIPISTITSLEAMAVSFFTDKNTLLVPVLDARRDYVYSAIFDNNYNVLMEPKYLSIDELEKTINNFHNDYVFITNDDFKYKREHYEPNFLNIVKYFNNKESVNPHEVDACYLKKTEAEEKSDN